MKARRILRVVVQLLALFLAVTRLWIVEPTQAQTPEYNTAFLTDAQLEDYASMTESDIRVFLKDHTSYFQQPIADVDGQIFDPSAVVAQAAVQYRISPKVILTTLQKESSGVTNSTRPSDQQMRFLMGCLTPSTARQQLTCAAERFRAYQDQLNKNGSTVSGWRVGVPKLTQDGVSVTPVTNAVAGQFTYTPYAGKNWGGNKANVGGVQLFYSTWNTFGFSGSTPPTPPATPPIGGRSYRIGIQAGHWGMESGALSCDKSIQEATINWAVANKVADELRTQVPGVLVDVFSAPASNVHNYSADAFVALHTDQCAGTNSGYKISRWKGTKGTGLDGSGDASDRLVQSLWSAYGIATGLPEDREPGHFAPCMVEYYALNPIDNGPICGGKYTQLRGISDSTPGAVIEMGWLSGDLKFITSTDGQEKMAKGVANGILNFLGYTSQSGSTATLLVLDVSGSMSENWHGGVKIESAKSAANQIVNMLQQESQVSSTAHRLGLATFTTDAFLNLPLTSDYNQARTAINGLTPQQSTNLGAGLTVANQALAQASTNESKIVILLSDGLTNTGLPADQILAGPVQEAVNAGTCIYTVGFGDPGSFDEDLLRRIAAASGCGQYYYATNVNDLQKIYIRVRHVSTGNLLAELSSTVAQGQTVQAGTVNVPSGQDELAVSLNWPGSALDLQITDPQGKAVDQAYPGANIATYSSLVYALIQKPISGTWHIAVYGREVPEGTTTFDALASVRPSPVLPTPEPTQPAPAPAATLPTPSPGPAIVVMLTVIAAGGVGVYALVKRQPRRATSTPGAEQELASLAFTSGSLAGQTTSIPTSGLVIGRGSACNLRLEDPAVSRQHARIRHATGAWFIQDLNSGGGTFVNGQRVQATRLNPGDQIQIGSSLFTFQVK
jgi:Mg-chelatase subunit ChlD/N-acetylmuramoyl-L-alanine amidase